MSSYWLDAAKHHIEHAWYGSSPSSHFFTKLKNISRSYRAFCQCMAHEMRAKEDAAKKRFFQASELLQAHPDDPTYQHQQGSARVHLQEVESVKVAGKHVRAKIRWKIYGDHMTSEFFKAIQEKSASSAITGLLNSQGLLIEEPDGIRQQ